MSTSSTIWMLLTYTTGALLLLLAPLVITPIHPSSHPSKSIIASMRYYNIRQRGVPLATNGRRPLDRGLGDDATGGGGEEPMSVMRP